MRVFAFFLMMTVAVGGTAVGYRLITGRDLINLADLGLVPQARSVVSASDPNSSRPVVVANPTPSPTVPPATPSPAPDTPQTMIVGNTDGQGVYLRRTPRMEDRVRAWRDGTKMEILGRLTESEGHKWWKVRAPDGAEGYVPAEYLTDMP